MANDIVEHILRNSEGITVKVINYGGTITQCLTPDGNGKLEDITLGFDTSQEYQQAANPFFGCLTGRYANRISKGRFSIGKQAYQLPLNSGANTLHGGISGFNRKFWDMRGDQKAVTLRYTSPDGEEGFPGALSVEVVYSLNDRNELTLDYRASTDRPTVLNLTNHTYFHLAPGEATVEAHEMQISADRFVVVDDDYIPTGEIRAVDHSVMDFRKAKLIGADLPKIKGGFDHTFVINKTGSSSIAPAGVLYHPGSRRQLEVFTTQPGMQFYTGNFLDGTLTGKKGVRYQRHAGLCLETQHFPDSPNQPSFPSTVLQPGEAFHQTTIYRFSVK